MYILPGKPSFIYLGNVVLHLTDFIPHLPNARQQRGEVVHILGIRLQSERV